MVVDHHLRRVSQTLLDHALCNFLESKRNTYSAVVHCRGRVDLNEPRIALLVDHEVVAEHLEGILPVLDHILDGLEGMNDNFLELGLHLLGPNIEAEVFLHPLLVGGVVPHEALAYFLVMVVVVALRVLVD